MLKPAFQADAKVLFLLLILAILFFHPLAFQPSLTLYSDHSDMLAMHLPMKQFLVESRQETGELPFWNPFSFAGSPLIHDPQVAAFYPLHWPLYWVAGRNLGAAMSWLIFLHVLIAGFSMYFYCQTCGLKRAGSLVAAVGFMFGGKWMLHLLAAGHSIFAGIAWLPLLILFLEKGIETGKSRWILGAGICFSLVLLSTHPQIVLYLGIFVACWTGATCLLSTPIKGEKRANRRLSNIGLWRWLFFGLGTAAVGALVGAVQLLPSLEALAETTRGQGVSVAEGLEEALQMVILFGPSFSDASWELHGGIAPFWMVAAVVAVTTCSLQLRPYWYVLLFLILFSLGGAALFQLLPGFNLFILPSRILLFASFPVAFLSGLATDWLQEKKTPEQGAEIRKIAMMAIAATSLFMLFCLMQFPAQVGEILEAWALVPIVLAGGLLLMIRPEAWSRRLWMTAWFGLLLADLWSIGFRHVQVMPQSEIYRSNAVVDFLVEEKERSNGRWRVLDRVSNGYDGTLLGSTFPHFQEIQVEPVLGYNSFDLYRLKQYLSYIADRPDAIAPRKDVFGYAFIGHFPIQNPQLLDLLGTRFLVQSAAFEPEDSLKETRERVFTDPAPIAYSIFSGGLYEFPPVTIYENFNSLPRAYFVSSARPMQLEEALSDLKAIDPRREVLLEGISKPISLSAAGSQREATIMRYTPNRIEIAFEPGLESFLLLTDPWFPGWRAFVNGSETPILRANFLFRCVRIPESADGVVFTFSPNSFGVGKWISFLTATGILVGLLIPTLSLWSGRSDR